MKIKLTILKNETQEDHKLWIQACEKYDKIIDYDVLDLSKKDWLERVLTDESACFLCRPSGGQEHYKQLYDERLSIISLVLKRNIYPTLLENLLYENKRMMAYWLESRSISHPKTLISYDYHEAKVVASALGFPIVAKTPIGAGGSGVRFINDQRDLDRYLNSVFLGPGIKRTWGPNLRKGSIIKRTISRLTDPVAAVKYFRLKKAIATKQPHRNHVILQQFIESDHEWRIVCIGNSYFGHKKLKGSGQMFSGTSKVSWDPPDEKLLEFACNVINIGRFYSMAIDLFEDRSNDFFVNELQCFWGSKSPHQMIVDGMPGRFVKYNDRWSFQKGNFNTNNSFDLRLQHVIRLYQKSDVKL